MELELGVNKVCADVSGLQEMACSRHETKSQSVHYDWLS